MGRKEYKGHLRFVEAIERQVGLTTKVYFVNNIETNIPLGEIKWHGAWRKYCFFPGHLTIFDPGCMREIIVFCEHLMKDRRIEHE